MAKYKSEWRQQEDNVETPLTNMEFIVQENTEPETIPVVEPVVIPEPVVEVKIPEPVEPKQIELVTLDKLQELMTIINSDYNQALRSVRNPVEININRLLLRAVSKFVNKK